MTFATRKDTMPTTRRLLISVAVAVLAVPGVSAQVPSLAAVAEQVNQKMVKLFGSGGYQGVNAYGTGILVSPDGYVLTASSPMLDTPELRIHLWDGRRLRGKVVVAEPVLDAALIKIDGVEDLPYFDVAAAARAPRAQPGDWVLGFSNQFQIGTRQDPMSVTHGVVAAYAKLHGRRGVFDAPYQGEVYIVDAVTNNPGAAGGALTTRTGQLLGVIGKEMRNSLTDTWMNYAVPVQALADFIEKGRRGEYRPVARTKPTPGPGGYHGLVLVPNAVERTPPYVEATLPGSPAARAGLKPDDLIVYVDGEKITSIKEFRDLVDHGKPSTVFRLEVRRGDRLLPVELKLEPLPEKPKP